MYIQKLDHAGIAIMSFGTFCPTALLLFPTGEGFLFLLLLLGSCVYTVNGIFTLKPSIYAQVMVPAVSVLFLHRLLGEFTPLETAL